MKTKFKGEESVLSYRHLEKIEDWARELSNDPNRVWTRSDSKLALLILIERRRVKSLCNSLAKDKELGFIDF